MGSEQGKRRRMMKMANPTMVKSTINISTVNFEELKSLVSEQAISSMTEGINLGIEMLIKEKRREMYQKQMAEAANDKDFLDRTLNSQHDFDQIDTEVSGQW